MFVLLIVILAAFVAVATANENLRKNGLASLSPNAKRTLNNNRERKSNKVIATIKAANKGGVTKQQAGKMALTETYNNFYEAEEWFDTDQCAGTASYSQIINYGALCVTDTNVVGGVTYLSTMILSNSGCTMFAGMFYTAVDCTGSTITGYELAGTYDPSCNGDGFVITNTTLLPSLDDDIFDDDDDDDDNGPADSYSYKYSYCGWTMPSFPAIPLPTVSTKSYKGSTNCAGDNLASELINADCFNGNGGTSYRIDSAGAVTVFSSPNCVGTSVTTSGVLTMGCAADGANSVSVAYTSPAVHWTAPLGFAALLTAVACVVV